MSFPTVGWDTCHSVLAKMRHPDQRVNHERMKAEALAENPAVVSCIEDWARSAVNALDPKLFTELGCLFCYFLLRSQFAADKLSVELEGKI